MYLSWRSRLDQQPTLRDLKQWPHVTLSSLTPKQQKGYLKNQRIVNGVLNGETMKAVAQRNQVQPSRISQIMARALAGALDDTPPLSRALIPGCKIKAPQRCAPLAELAAPSGSRCAFQHLLTVVPRLESELEALIKASLKPVRYGQNLSAKVFHAAFLRLLQEAHWPCDRYPYTHTSLAYESTRRYLKRRMHELMQPKQRARPVVAPRPLCSQAYLDVQIDEQCMDVHGMVGVSLLDGWEPLRVSRISLLSARDVATDCILGAQVALTSHPTQDDMLALLAQLHQPWGAIALQTPGLEYPPGACFPTALGEPFQRVAIGMIQLDNALAHLATSVQDYICETLGATLNLGFPAHPKARNSIEQAFGLLNIDIHRFPSTTGSHPHDPIKEPRSHRKKAPLLSLKSLEEAISVVFANHNIRHRANLAHQSPLGVIQHQMAHQCIPMMPPHFMPASVFTHSSIVTVHQKKSDRRAPHINFQYVEYKDRDLTLTALIGQKVRVEYDRRDVRNLKAYRLTGEYLGVVCAPRTWQRFAHSITTRRHIQALKRKQYFRASDPLGGYFEHLMRLKNTPKEALEMVRLYREIQSTDPTLDDSPRNDRTNDGAVHTYDRPNAVPPWTPAMVVGRGPHELHQ